MLQTPTHFRMFYCKNLLKKEDICGSGPKGLVSLRFLIVMEGSTFKIISLGHIQNCKIKERHFTLSLKGYMKPVKLITHANDITLTNERVNVDGQQKSLPSQRGQKWMKFLSVLVYCKNCVLILNRFCQSTAITPCHSPPARGEYS